MRNLARTLPRHRARGFTLLELLVVMAILGLLYAIVAPQVIRYLGSSKTSTAQVQVRNIAQAIEQYQLDNGHIPTQEQGLNALVAQPANEPAWNGPYFARSDGLVDPWKRPYQYHVPGKAGPYSVETLGADGAPGGTGEDRDITN